MQLNLNKGGLFRFAHEFLIGNSVFFVPELHNVIRETINNNLSVCMCNRNYLNNEFEAKYLFTFFGDMQSDKYFIISMIAYL